MYYDHISNSIDPWIRASIWVLLFHQESSIWREIEPKRKGLRLQKSSQWKKAVFQNQSKTTMEMSLTSLPKLIQGKFQGRKTRNPKGEIPFNHLIIAL